MRNKEIGGYLEIESCLGKSDIFHRNLIHLNTGRNCLAYLIKALDIKKVYLPYYLCESVLKLCQREGCKYEFYNIDYNFLPIFEKTLQEKEYLYIVNYYGFLSNGLIQEYKSKHKNIIVDNVQAFYQEPVKNVPTIYSCRKWFGMPDGAFLYSPVSLEINATDDSSNRFSHLFGRKKDGATAHYGEFKANDKSFVDLPLMNMSKQTSDLFKQIDFKKAAQIRKCNYEFLRKLLNAFNPIDYDCSSVPFCYPFYVKDGMNIKKVLAERQIYIPSYWPNVFEEEKIERDFTDNVLPLPCDQRYSLNDMKSIIEELNEICHLNEPKFITKRLKVFELNYSFLSVVNKWHNDDQLYKTLVGDIFHPSLEDERKWITNYLLNNDKHFRGVIVDNDNNPIGSIYLLNISPEKSFCNIAVFIADKQNRGLGYGQEVFSSAIDFAHKKYGIQTIELKVLANNTSAYNLYVKNGFHTISEEEKNKDGKLVKVLVMRTTIK